MSAQRARSAVAADHRSAHPNIPGVPWWGAVLIAITATAIGFAFDAGSGNRELSAVFAACYVIGCVAAVLAARQAAVFTAVIQPPLILFVSVPATYFLFTSGQGSGLKDLAINCGYPLIERFPLMFFTSAAVLLIGMLRWYRGMSARHATPKAAAEEAKPGVLSALTAKLAARASSLLTRAPAEDDEDDEDIAEPPRRRRSSTRPTATGGRSSRTSSRGTSTREGTRAGKPTRAGTSSRSRHVRPPDTELVEPVSERPRRSRNSRQAEPRRQGEPRRRTRTPNPRQSDPPPVDRRSGYDRPERRRRYDDYQPREPHRNGNNTHHPISRVRYRGEENDDRAEYRTRRTRDWDADSWEYDV